MAFKDLLVHVDETKACAARVRAAIDLAIAYEAHLTAVYVVPDSSPTTFVQGYMPPEMLEMMQREARERA
ncbi:MAG TPA: universal stress protein, partial [Geminicoccaceae bacterium]|nr:universal stress protein [Geminicoccaceae bacterium]